ncbi:MAG: TusE/DsrC/DsvC family sulfur relay protein [Alkalimonas sp.]|nr:TusE/DsrC/DsvC family sulfur relay protein [Alkalimonas sp.]
MSEIVVNGITYSLDKHGYLADSSLWNPAIAECFAELEGIALSEAHWEVVNFVRDFYQQHHTSPAIRLLVKAMAQHYGAEKGSSKYLFMLFPDGPAKQATRIAGLPKPARCL